MNTSCPGCSAPISRWRVLFRGKGIRCQSCKVELATHLGPWRALLLFLTIWGFIGAIPFFFRTKHAWPAIALFALLAYSQLAYLPLVRNVPLPFWQSVKRNWPYFVFSFASLVLGLSLGFLARSLRS